MDANIWNLPPEVTLTNAIYRASLKPAVRNLFNIQDEGERIKEGMRLSAIGESIDVWLMIWWMDAPAIMWARKTAGYTWVPAAGMPPVEAGPGQGLPGMTPYDPSKMPPGAIKVSVDARDYPAWDPPAPGPDLGRYVGRQWFDGSPYFVWGPASIKNGIWQVTQGQVINQDGASYQADFYSTIAGVALRYIRL